MARVFLVFAVGVGLAATSSEGSSLGAGGHPSAYYGRGYNNNYDASWRPSVGSVEDDAQNPAILAREEEKPLPPGWAEYFDQGSGQPYYHNSNDGTTTWDRPVTADYVEQVFEETTSEVNVTEVDPVDYGNEKASVAGSGQDIVDQTESEAAVDSNFMGYDYPSQPRPEEETRGVPGDSVLTSYRIDETNDVQMHTDERPPIKNEQPSLQPAWGVSDQPRVQTWGSSNQGPPRQNPSLPIRTEEGASPTAYEVPRQPSTASQSNANAGNPDQSRQQVPTDYRGQPGLPPDRKHQNGPSPGHMQGTIPPRGDLPAVQPPRSTTPGADNLNFQPKHAGDIENKAPQRLSVTQSEAPLAHQHPGAPVQPVPGRPFGVAVQDPRQEQQQAQNQRSQTNVPPRGDGPQGQYNTPPWVDGFQRQFDPPPRGNSAQGQYTTPPPRGDGSQSQFNAPPRRDGPQGQYYAPPRGDGSQGQYNAPPRGDGPQGQFNAPPRGDGPQGYYNAPHRNGPADNQRTPPEVPYPRGPYAPSHQKPQSQYGNPGSPRPPQQQNSPYGQYQQHGPPYGQQPPRRSNQLVSEETSTAVRGAIGSAWQGIVGFGNRTKEVVETAKSSVVNTAKEATQTISTKSTSWWGQARTTLGSLFEPGDEVSTKSPYSLTGDQVNQQPLSGGPGNMQAPGMYPAQQGRYPYPQQQAPNPYNNPPGYPPRYPQGVPSYPGPKGPPSQSGHNRPLSMSPYPPGYRPPQPRADQPYAHERSPPQGPEVHRPQAPPQRQGPPPQTQWGKHGTYPPTQQNWQPQQQQYHDGHGPPLDSPAKDEKEASAAWTHPGLSPDF